MGRMWLATVVVKVLRCGTERPWLWLFRHVLSFVKFVMLVIFLADSRSYAYKMNVVLNLNRSGQLEGFLMMSKDSCSHSNITWYFYEKIRPR